jgi:chromosome segregation ATPase
LQVAMRTLKLPGMTADTFARDAALPLALRGYAREPVDALLQRIEESYRALISERDGLRVDLATATERLAEVTAELERHGGQEQAVTEVRGELLRLEEANRTLSTERDELRSDLTSATERMKEVEAELEHYIARERAVADVLIEVRREVGETRSRAEQEVQALKAAVEREAEELKAVTEREAEEIRRAAELDAEETVRDAQVVKAQLEAEIGELRAQAEIESDELLRDARTRADQLVEDVQRNLEERQHLAQDLLDDARARLGSLVRDLFEQVDGASREQDSVVAEPSET